MCRRSTNAKAKNKPTQGSDTIDDVFEVLVLATMSAGKTSFINALIGQEILHAANEATTACLTSVEHYKRATHFSGVCYSYSGQELAHLSNTSRETVRDWNANQAVKRIHLRGKFLTESNLATGLVLHDTPGPNNSQNERHAQLMFEAVRTVSFKALCYVLNASQLGTQDDRGLLEQIHEELAGKPCRPIYFILNKVDLLDAEQGEDIHTYTQTAQDYLVRIGFEQPMIIPTMANVALYARKALKAEPLTRVQHSRLLQALDDFRVNKKVLLEATIAPSPIKKRMLRVLADLERLRRKRTLEKQVCERIELQQLVTISGMRTVEALIKYQRQLEDSL